MHMHMQLPKKLPINMWNSSFSFLSLLLPIFSFLVQIGLEIYLVALGEPQFRGDLFSRNFKCPARCRCSKHKGFCPHLFCFYQFNIFYRDLKDPTTRQNFDDTVEQKRVIDSLSYRAAEGMRLNVIIM